MEISFIYKEKTDTFFKFGKLITDYISDDHDGLDIEVRHSLISAIHYYKKKIGDETPTEVSIGILGQLNDFCSNEERFVFDIYIENFNNAITVYHQGQKV